MAREGEYHSNFVDARQIAKGALSRPGPDGTGQALLFDRIDWFEMLHAACLADQPPVILSPGDAHGRLWLFLTRRTPTRLSAMSHWYSFAFRPVWTGTPDKAALLAMAATSLKAMAGDLILHPVPDDNDDVQSIIAALRTAGWIVRATPTSTSHWLDTGGRRFDDWWAARPGALRSTVQRKAKKGRVAIELTSTFSDAQWDEFEAVYSQSWKPAESHPAFLRAWARQEGAAGTLRLGMARIDGIAVAAQFWSCDTGIAYIHKLAHARGQDALSPGTLLTHALFRQAFDVDRVRRIDFGTGDDGYKRDWMEASAPLWTIEAWNPMRPAAWPGLARRLISGLAARRRSG